jgi:hypothetical protein
VLRPLVFPQRALLLIALGLLLTTMGAIAVGSGLLLPKEEDPAPPSALGGMWPQTTLEEVRQAQERADAGDTRYTWQMGIDGLQVGQNHPCAGSGNGCWMPARNDGLFTRFLQEKLGWEAFFWDEAFAHRGFNAGDVIFVRCAPGRANPLYPTDSACAPTIDELRYETVKISVAQPDREGDSGIWVVTGWEMIEPAAQADPRVVEAEARALLQDFLEARIDGEGAEGYAGFSELDPFADLRSDQGIPLLYATSDGTPYERWEIALVEGPLWPTASMQFAVRLFAENGETVVEQVFSLDRDDNGRLRLVYEFEGGPAGPGPGTTENGNAVPEAYAFLDDAVTFRAAYPLGPSEDDWDERDRLAIGGLLPGDDAPRRILVFLADPRLVEPGCVAAPAASDAETLARSIQADPGYAGTAPVAVTIGGLPALQLDSVRVYESSCGFGLVPSPAGSNQERLYLLDLPGGSARVLGILIAADEDSFETVLGWAAPIVDSIEFRAP